VNQNVKPRAGLIAKLLMMILLAFSILVMGCTTRKPKPIPPILEWYYVEESACVSKEDAKDLAVYLLELEGE